MQAGPIPRARTLVSGVLLKWPSTELLPYARIRDSLGQAGCIEAETQVGMSSTMLASVDACKFLFQRP